MEKIRNVSEAVIFNSKGEVLLQKKTKDYPAIPGGWFLFFGGEIEENEDPKDAIKRELKEELGTDIEVLENIAILDYVLIGKYKGKRNIFKCKFNGNISDIKLSEGGGFAFFDYSELHFSKVEESVIEILENYFALKK